MSNLFDASGEIRMRADDGYRVIRTEEHPVTGAVSLRLRLFVEGQADIGYLAWHCPHKPSPEEWGECMRVQLLLEAICRYLNTGGSWSSDHFPDGDAVLEIMSRLGCLSFGEDWNLLNSSINQNGQFEHLFHQNGTRNLIRWVENQFIEKLDINDCEGFDDANIGGPGDSLSGDLPAAPDSSGLPDQEQAL